MLRRIQQGKRNFSIDESHSNRKRTCKRLPHVVLKGYAPPVEIPNISDLCTDNASESNPIEAPPEIIKCSECERSFGGWSDLRQHFKDEHSKPIEDENGQHANTQDEDEANGDAVDEGNESMTSGNDLGEANGNSPNDSKIRTTWCDICKKHLATVSSRNLHMRIHTGERPFVCPYCNKSFTQNVHLRSHMSVHTGAKPYVCDVCGKGFVAGRTLKIHMMSHTRENPHACRCCGRKFLLRNHLLLHMQTHHSSDHESASINLPPAGSNQSSRNEISSPATSRRSARMKYQLQPPQRVMFYNSTTKGDCGNLEQDDQLGHDQEDDTDSSLVKYERNECVEQQEPTEGQDPQSAHYEWQLSSVKIEPHDSDHSEIDQRSSSASVTAKGHPTPRPNRLSAALSNLRNSKSDRKSISPLFANDEQKTHTQPCPNCAIVDSELQLLKTELAVIKQFLGSKLTLMEQKIDNIRLLIK